MLNFVLFKEFSADFFDFGSQVNHIATADDVTIFLKNYILLQNFTSFKGFLSLFKLR